MSHSATAHSSCGNPHVAETLMDIRQAAEMLGVSVWTMADWRRGQVPRNSLPYVKQRGRILYRFGDLVNFKAARDAVQLRDVPSA